MAGGAGAKIAILPAHINISTWSVSRMTRITQAHCFPCTSDRQWARTQGYVSALRNLTSLGCHDRQLPHFWSQLPSVSGGMEMRDTIWSMQPQSLRFFQFFLYLPAHRWMQKMSLEMVWKHKERLALFSLSSDLSQTPQVWQLSLSSLYKSSCRVKRSDTQTFSNYFK